MLGTSTGRALIIMHTLAIAAEITCLSIVANLRNIRLRDTKITHCVLAVRFVCDKTLFVRYKDSLNRALIGRSNSSRYSKIINV
jgi:hypothetical protein